MIENAQFYAETIFTDKLQGSLNSTLLVEQTVAMPELHPHIFSTFDASFYDKEAKHLKVYDYKYGKSIQVEAKDNNQLLCYALLASKDIEPRSIYENQPKIKRWNIKYNVVEKFKESLVQAINRVDNSQALIQSSVINHVLNLDPDSVGLSNNGSHCKYCLAKAECSS